MLPIVETHLFRRHCAWPFILGFLCKLSSFLKKPQLITLKTLQLLKVVNGVSHSPKTSNIFLIRFRMTDAGMNVGLRGAITMHAIFHQIVSHFVNVNVKTAIAKRLWPNVTSVISSSSVLDVSISGTICCVILTILHSLELLANYCYTSELISFPTMGLLSSIYMTTTRLIEH